MPLACGRHASAAPERAAAIPRPCRVRPCPKGRLRARRMAPARLAHAKTMLFGVRKPCFHGARRAPRRTAREDRSWLVPVLPDAAAPLRGTRQPGWRTWSAEAMLPRRPRGRQGEQTMVHGLPVACCPRRCRYAGARSASAVHHHHGPRRGHGGCPQYEPASAVRSRASHAGALQKPLRRAGADHHRCSTATITLSPYLRQPASA